MFINPNQNYNQVFQIVANDASTVTVGGIISSLMVVGQLYFVLKARDTARYQRILARLQGEFSDTDVRIHVFFV